MSGKKGKAGGRTDVGAVSAGTPVRVLYDDMGWFHGDVIQVLEEEKKTLAQDKETLTAANEKLLAQFRQMFSFGQAVQTGLAFKGLSVNATPGL